MMRLGWASAQAARYACEQWHYSGSMPASKSVRVGCWEEGQFVGVVIFSQGANLNIGKPYGLKGTQTCELTRVAFCSHKTPISQCVALALRWLKKHSPGLRLVVSYADTEQGHHGGIYQAGNWIYVGMAGGGRQGWLINGRHVRTRAIPVKAFGRGSGSHSTAWVRANLDPNAQPWMGKQKHKYVMPLDRNMRKQVQKLAKPYPRGSSDNGDAPGHQSGEGGSIPTLPLAINHAEDT